MRSLARDGIAGNVKMKGKLGVMLLNCGCCAVRNLKSKYLIDQEKKEIQLFKKGEKNENQADCSA
jgi:hypothetical protein